MISLRRCRYWKENSQSQRWELPPCAHEIMVSVGGKEWARGWIVGEEVREAMGVGGGVGTMLGLGVLLADLENKNTDSQLF